MNRMNKYAVLQYKGYSADGELFDDSGDDTAEFLLGAMQLMRPLENAVLEMEIGEERTVKMSAAQAYGEVREDLIQKVGTFFIENSEGLEAGKMVMWRANKEADPVPARVISVENEVALLDFNHPLAGRDVTYWIKLIDIHG